MVKTALFLIIFLTSCSIKTIKLENGMTKVPADKHFFDKYYRERYTTKSFKKIDCNAIYIEAFHSVDIPYKKFFDSRIRNSFIHAIKFYNNGCLNLFNIDTSKIDTQLFNLNPKKNGYRGVSYIKNNESLIDIIVPINDVYSMGKKTYRVKINGDTLVLTDKKNHTRYLYLKKELSKQNLIYKPFW